jgi:hypothetical protein
VTVCHTLTRSASEAMSWPGPRLRFGLVWAGCTIRDKAGESFRTHWVLAPKFVREYHYPKHWKREWLDGEEYAIEPLPKSSRKPFANQK